MSPPSHRRPGNLGNRTPLRRQTSGGARGADADWQEGSLGLEFRSKHGGIVRTANNKIFDYNLDAILRLGWFRVRIENDGFIIWQAATVMIFAVAIMVACLAATHAGWIRITKDHVSRFDDVFKYFGEAARRPT